MKLSAAARGDVTELRTPNLLGLNDEGKAAKFATAATFAPLLRRNTRSKNAHAER
jgi:hypothetical protein